MAMLYFLLSDKPKYIQSNKPNNLKKENKESDSIKNLKSLQIEDLNFKKEDRPIGRYKRDKIFEGIGNKKSSFKILPGSDIIEKYDYNDRDVKKTINDFVKDPSVEGEVKIKF